MDAPARLLVDAGPLVALFNRRDRWHAQARGFFGAYHGTLVTTWPVLAEAAHFIALRAPDLLELVAAGRIEIVEAPGTAVRIAALMRAYADLPMDLADATLVAAAERLGSATSLRSTVGSASTASGPGDASRSGHSPLPTPELVFSAATLSALGAAVSYQRRRPLPFDALCSYVTQCVT